MTLDGMLEPPLPLSVFEMFVDEVQHMEELLRLCWCARLPLPRLAIRLAGADGDYRLRRADQQEDVADQLVNASWVWGERMNDMLGLCSLIFADTVVVTLLDSLNDKVAVWGIQDGKAHGISMPVYDNGEIAHERRRQVHYDPSNKDLVQFDRLVRYLLHKEELLPPAANINRLMPYFKIDVLRPAAVPTLEGLS